MTAAGHFDPLRGLAFDGLPLLIRQSAHDCAEPIGGPQLRERFRPRRQPGKQFAQAALVECRQAALAETLFNHSRPLFSVQFERKEGIKYTWLEGRIAAALNHGALAEQRFRDARASFEEFKLPAYVALVSLDMASLWLRAGRTPEIMALVEETIAIFQAVASRR